MTKLIALSGPPRSGKDTIGNELAAVFRQHHPKIDVAVEALSMPLRYAIYALSGIPYTREHYEAQKDVPQGIFDGRTIREAIIALAEHHVRPIYGIGFFAQSLVNKMCGRAPDVIIITDLGFEQEVEVFDNAYGLDNVAYPQIVRVGCSFLGDSRSYVGTPGRRTTIINDADAATEAARLYGRLVDQLGMKFG